MAQDIETHIRDSIPAWSRDFPGVEDLKVAVMGCIVNGPGESKHADLGISLPGTAEDPKAPVYVDGAHHSTLQGEGMVEEFKTILENYIQNRYG
jgi:(E)-4-hydroxy-3-methylbut-2-enyl-diphosphate synthase